MRKDKKIACLKEAEKPILSKIPSNANVGYLGNENPDLNPVPIEDQTVWESFAESCEWRISKFSSLLLEIIFPSLNQEKIIIIVIKGIKNSTKFL